MTSEELERMLRLAIHEKVYEILRLVRADGGEPAILSGPLESSDMPLTYMSGLSCLPPNFEIKVRVG
jgi:hypothetical protein